MFFYFSFLSVEYFSSQLNLGFLTASRALNSGKAEYDLNMIMKIVLSGQIVRPFSTLHVRVMWLWPN